MIDFDQSGTNPGQRVRIYNGPSLGWVETQVRPPRTITSVSTFPILPGDSVIHVNVAGAVTLLLPSVIVWVTENAYQPAVGFERSIWIKDLGGFAATFPITITPFAGQFIDLQASFQLIENRQMLRLYYLPDLSGWFSG
jgi:hypothetical protein